MRLHKNSSDDTQNFVPLHGKMQVIDEYGTVTNVDILCKNDPEKAQELKKQFAFEANLCAGRNEACISYFRNIYPAEYLVINITKVDIPKEVKAYMIRLLTSLYIDNPPF